VKPALQSTQGPSLFHIWHTYSFPSLSMMAMMSRRGERVVFSSAKTACQISGRRYKEYGLYQSASSALQRHTQCSGCAKQHSPTTLEVTFMKSGRVLWDEAHDEGGCYSPTLE
jgi:hypothetical protein